MQPSETGVAEADSIVRRPRSRKARGQSRPCYLDSPDLDRVFIMMMSMLSEISALRDRLDTHEALVEGGTMPTRAAVEAFALDAARGAAREAERDALLTRVLRVLFEERDADAGGGRADQGD